MAESVEADAGHVEPEDLSVEQLVDRLGVNRVACGVGEDRVVGADRWPSRCWRRRHARSTPSVSLSRSMHRRLVRVFTATSTALGDDLTTPGDGEPMGALVPVAPAEPGASPLRRMAGATARCSAGCKRRCRGGREELGELFSGPTFAAALAQPRPGGCAPSAGFTVTRCWRTAWVNADWMTTWTRRPSWVPARPASRRRW